MPCKTNIIFAADGSFAIDTVTPHRACLSVERALDTWYRLHPNVTPALWVSSHLHGNIVWIIERYCGMLATPVRVYRHSDLAAGIGRCE